MDEEIDSSLFSKFRQPRTPLDFEITIDTVPYCNNSRQMYLNLLPNTSQKVPSFLIPNEKCIFPFPVTEEEQIDTTDHFRICLSCANDEKYKNEADILEAFRGDINSLAFESPKPSNYQ
jgi:hypothetical protein